VTELRGKKIDFVKAVLEGKGPKAAALAAGYAPECATRTARRLMTEDVAVHNAIERAKALKRETAAQLDECRRVAIENGDAGAAVKAVELLTQIRTCGVQ
jgi:phage terminase small subunit